MSWHSGKYAPGIVLLLTLLTGCYPSQPFYLNEGSDLAYYLDTATQIEYPDAHVAPLEEVTQAQQPPTLSDPFQSGQFWDLTLEDAVSIALQNSKVIRSSGTILPSADRRTLAPDELIGNPQPEASATVYDAALVESDPANGVEAALAQFDAQLSSSLFWERADRFRRSGIPPFGFFSQYQDFASFNFELSKKAATGTELFFRNVTEYDYDHNAFFNPPQLVSAYTTALELEVRQPLLRGAGTQVNRIPVVIARINHDISLADFEANVRNLVMDVERAYWDLSCKYRILDASKRARDLALETWRDIEAELRQAETAGDGNVSYQGGGRTAEDELRARGQYYGFRAQVETALRDLYNAESRLRWLMGLAAADGRMLRPIDEPTSSRIAFDWQEIHCEALARTAELRRQKWVIKQRELELIAARNRVLPDLNVAALYRWVGQGDHLARANRQGINFPNPGSTALESLTGGRFQEFRFGLELGLPVGFRRELAGVRNAQLALARERARLQEMELNVSHLLAMAVRDLDGLLVLAQTQLNQWAANRSEVQALIEKRRAGEDVDIDFILRAFQRAVAAEIAYYQAICDYNVAIAQVHFRKGSLLEYDNICLAEGPWPKKAYWDALGHARRRSASRYLDYGWSRPRVISRGAVPQHPGTSRGMLVVPSGQLPASPTAPPEEVPTPEPETAQRSGSSQPAATVPQQASVRRSAPVERTITDEPGGQLADSDHLAPIVTPQSQADQLGPQRDQPGPEQAAGPLANAIGWTAVANGGSRQVQHQMRRASFQQPSGNGATPAATKRAVVRGRDLPDNPLR